VDITALANSEALNRHLFVCSLKTPKTSRLLQQSTAMVKYPAGKRV